MKTKKKVPVAAEFSPWSGTPLAELALAGLPAAEDAVAPTPAPAPAPPARERIAFPAKPGEVILRKETSGRAGKTVLVLRGWSAAWTDETLRELARQARQACGCGGTYRADERAIELQAGESSRVRPFLEGLGLRVRGV